MKNNRFALGVTAAAVLLLVGLAAELFLPALMGRGDPHVEVPEEFAQQIAVHANGDFTYSYTLDDVEVDLEAKTLYVPGLINIFPEHVLTRREKQKLAEQADGTVVSDVCGDLNLVQLYVETESYSELEQVAQELRQADGILDVSCETPAFVASTSVTPATEPDTNPWAAGGTAPDEANPSGSNWGAEAIGAYTAWQYEQWCHDVTVGIIDSGFCLDHEDLEGNTIIQMLPGYEANTVTDHGAAVAGIIAAADNDIGLRGIASGPYHQLRVYCADWSPKGDSAAILLGTSQLFEVVKCMVEQGVQVLNCSFGINDVSYNAFWKDKFKDAEDKKYEGYGLQELADYIAQSIYDSTRASLIMMMQLILAEKQFLIVQSAGNGVDNGKIPNLSTETGYFAGITQEFYQQMFPNGHHSVDYTEVDHRILVVGAVENKRTEDGNYMMTSYSSYGPEVDLCAPGDELYTTGANRSAYNENFYGTSAAAPMVTGAAALLWSMDPALTAREVWDLLVNSNEVMAEGTKDNGHPFMGSEGSYPMLNIGAAVRALMEKKSEELLTKIQLTDAATGEPVEGAEVIYCHSFFDGVQSVVTDGEGDCSFRGADDLRPYPAETTVLVKAEGQLRWCGTVRAWLEDDLDQTVNEIELDLNNILDVTGDLLNQLKEDLPALWEYVETIMDQVEPAEADFSDTLAQLTGQYGVISLGEEVYPEVTGYGGGEELVDPARLTGLLEADIFDYDGDGQEELLTVRLETEAGSDEGWGETRCFLTVYEWDGAAEQAVPVGEKSFRFNALTNSLTQSAIHLARGTFDNGETGLYLTYSWEMNDCVFGVLRISYQGELEVTGGVECHDFHGAFYCYDAVGSGAMDALCQSGFVDSDGWMPLEVYEFEGSSDIPDQDRVHNYRNCYMKELENIGLIEPGLPGQWMNPDRPTGNDLETIIQASQFDRASIVRKPADRYIVSNGQLTNLCGLWHLSSTALLEEDMTLSVYDEGELLTPWR